MVVVDTSVWIDYFNGRPTPQAALLDDLVRRKRLLVGDLIVAEVLQGYRDERDFQQALRLMGTLEFCGMLGLEVAIASARNYRLMRSRGVTVRKTIDVMIGTFCILNDHVLLHSDRDFDLMAEHLGLKILRAQ
jgi:predicted nucleic acid-binding protein